MVTSIDTSLAELHQQLALLTAPGAPFEIVEQPLSGQPMPVYAAAPQNLRAIYEAALAHGDKTFLVYHQQRLSFAQTYASAASLAAALAAQLGVKKGERVAIAMRNNPEWVISFMAITALGAIAVPMNGWWSSDELGFGLRDCGAKLVIADSERAERIAALGDELAATIVLVGDGGEPQPALADCVALATLLEQYRGAPMSTVAIAPDDDATILYTSGSSGNPKGVVASHRSIVTALVSWMLLGIATENAGQKPPSAPPTAEAVALLTIPLFHVTGCHSLFLMSLVIGRTVVMMHKWDADEALRLIEQERVTYVNGVPTMSQELLDAAQYSARDLSSLSELASGGAARPVHHVNRIANDFKLNPVNGYGLTETNAIGAVNGGETYLQCPDSVGIPSPAVTEIRIIDDGGKPLAVGQPGEICIKSAANARGYWNNPVATAEAFQAGWFHTGDVGYLDQHGMLYVVDRLKEIIIRGGENISCSQVEGAIYANPSVAEVAVFGLPDPRLGEIVAATLYLKRGASLTVAALQQFVAERLAAFKVPAVVHISNEPLPRTATDKIFKRKIRDTAIAARTVQPRQSGAEQPF